MSNLLFVFGVFFIFWGAVGMIILPDIFLRFHAATKCSVVGLINILMGLMISSHSPEQAVKIALIMLFILATSPITVHLLCLSFFYAQKDEEEHHG
ncbi:monovalent cation/H(+) antiporter subunit G [Chitinivibrio alkaliphilus]|uniref:Putative monovalent cation/H+ antiporter subunit G n=1 Tax=Chitinivibrio alkaliphilus ACht1 TaxID=1313304 RepID=U7D5V2_9BACT|nr:monovalent cation/H(+) antiporter subunit G [Chitinivibrio alkaliphilus]ERP30941.1 putative monovalent cation/H+ antiporter subunit G [Chitinivibrio alkaliphilus ACht1]